MGLLDASPMFIGNKDTENAVNKVETTRHHCLHHPSQTTRQDTIRNLLGK